MGLTALGPVRQSAVRFRSAMRSRRPDRRSPGCRRAGQLELLAPLTAAATPPPEVSSFWLSYSRPCLRLVSRRGRRLQRLVQPASILATINYRTGNPPNSTPPGLDQSVPRSPSQLTLSRPLPRHRQAVDRIAFLRNEAIRPLHLSAILAPQTRSGGRMKHKVHHVRARTDRGDCCGHRRNSVLGRLRGSARRSSSLSPPPNIEPGQIHPPPSRRDADSPFPNH